MADQDITKMKVAELRVQLKNRGLNVVGNKQELMDRLQTALLDGDNSMLNDDEDELDDGILNDDDLDEEKSLLDSTHDEILKSPAGSTKSSSPEVPAITAKKVSLKRNISVVIPSLESSKTKVTSSDDSQNDSGTDPEKKIIKLSELTSQSRIEMRAKKFGADTAAATDRKEARAARFGITAIESTPVTPKNNKISSVAPVSLEVLKKRAERFGTVTAPAVKSTQLDEKLQKRQERFGSVAITAPSTTASAPTATGTSDYAEKARLRAERFKTAA
ncbi:unnamed protein product [Diamesa serratosioi]